MGSFNISLLNITETTTFQIFCCQLFFAPYILQKNSKTRNDNIFLNSIVFNTFSGNISSQICGHLPLFSILKDFHHKTLINSINVFDRNYRFFNHDEFKNGLKDIPWDNILSSDDISGSLAFNLFFPRVNTLLDEHGPHYRFCKREISLKAKTWNTRNVTILEVKQSKRILSELFSKALKKC